LALTIALCWLRLLALPELHSLPDGFQRVQDRSAAVCTWGRPTFLGLALVALDLLHVLLPPG
jgi:hypothetical protein